MPPQKTLTCKKCKASFVPENDLQKILMVCNECLKKENEKSNNKM